MNRMEFSELLIKVLDTDLKTMTDVTGFLTFFRLND